MLKEHAEIIIEIIDDIEHYEGELSGNEYDFIMGMADYPEDRMLTDAQKEWLNDIAVRLEVR